MHFAAKQYAKGIVGMKVLNPYGPCPVASHPRFLNAITVVALEGLNSGLDKAWFLKIESFDYEDEEG
ncbi:hypothetical protein ACSBR2_020335 [Camellia fascicularis]